MKDNIRANSPPAQDQKNEGTGPNGYLVCAANDPKLGVHHWSSNSVTPNLAGLHLAHLPYTLDAWKFIERVLQRLGVLVLEALGCKIDPAPGPVRTWEHDLFSEASNRTGKIFIKYV